MPSSAHSFTEYRVSSACAQRPFKDNPRLRIYGEFDNVRADRSLLVDNTEYELLHSTGDLRLDFSINSAIRDIFFKYGYQSGDSPAVFFYDDAGAENGWALNTAVLPGTFSTILLGKHHTSNQLTIGGSAVRVLIGHETGHTLQYKTNTRLQGRLIELQADYMAGWDLGSWLQNSPEAARLSRDAAHAMAKIGTMVRTPASEATHGFPNERFVACMEGFFLGNGDGSVSALDALQSSVNVIHHIVAEKNAQ